MKAEFLPAELLALEPAWWEQPGPVEADLGCARGHFLVAAARQFPATRFLGIEWQARRARETWRKLQNQGLTNARVLRGEILTTLREHIPAARLQRVHVLFPDPWPKRRHAARRLLQPAAWNEFARILQPSGEVRFLTDDLAYFQQTRRILHQLPDWHMLTEDVEAVQLGWPPTEFQSRFLRLHLPLYGLLAEWIPSTANAEPSDATTC